MGAATPDHATHERLLGVQRLCDHCWHPIPWGDVAWRRIADFPKTEWVCLHTACLTSTEVTS